MTDTAVILLSRQARRPYGSTPWIVRTARAVEHLAQEGVCLNSSIGMSTWEMITILGAKAGGPMRLFLIVNSTNHFQQLTRKVMSEFALDPELTDFVPVTADTTKDRSAALQARDRMIVEKSRLLVPISVRPDGSMARRLERPGPKHDIDPSFRTEYVAESTECAEDFSTKTINATIDSATSGFLFHWTRSADTAWPGERLEDYYTAIIASSEYPRLALPTLSRIASTRTLVATTNHMPGKTATVSFTSLSPSKTVPLMKWRTRYSQMSFEPYAIGIRGNVAEQLGIVPVHYYDKRDKRSIAHLEPWQTQSRGEITDWKSEQEHRHQGDLDLRSVSTGDLILVCRSSDEVAGLEAATGIEALPLFAS